MKKVVTLFLALMLLLAAVPGLAVDQHEPEFYEQQIQLLTENLQKWYEENYGEGALVAPYDEPVEVNIVNYYNTTLETNMATWNEWWGETLEKNRYTEAIERALNIKINYLWLKNDADKGYINQLRLSTAAGEIPDMFIVTEQTDLIQLAEAGVIMPVEDVIDQYFTTKDKEIQNSDGGMLYEMATYEGQVYGVPCNVSDTDTFSYIWLRKDWLDALKLEAPKTMEELKTIMTAFKEADFNGKNDSFGMLIDKDLYYSTRGLFAGFGAYPEFWVQDDATGEIAWGGTQENIKAALTYLNGLYNEGLLDPEFITQTNADALSLMLNSQTGVIYAGHWIAHNLQNLHDEDDNAEWICVDLPSLDGSPVEQYLTPVKRGWIVINKDYEHPEVAAKIRALCTFASQGGVVDGTWWFSNDQAQILEPFQASVSSWDNYDTYLNLLECFASGDTSVLKGKAVTYWGNMSSDSSWAWHLMFGDGDYTPMRVLGRAIEEDRIEYDKFLGAQSEFMQDRWSTIKDEQLIAFTKMIIGDVGIDEGFAAWQATFAAMGGDRITEEVNDWYRLSQEKKAE
ncbi:extracellular solute-binding protein [Beduinella massiliensis]|uniref:extracellular solute-binding protein n=1 Tax=Beduinella massiliensis TaxID=1852363 RepID=UPI000C825D94